MEEDYHAEAAPVVESPGHRLGALNEWVVTLAARVDDPVIEVGPDILPVPLQGESQGLGRFELTPAGSAEPGLEVLGRHPGMDVVEEGHKI